MNNVTYTYIVEYIAQIENATSFVFTALQFGFLFVISNADSKTILFKCKVKTHVHQIKSNQMYVKCIII